MRPRIGVPGWPVGSRAQSPSSRIPPHFLSLLASSFPSSGTHLHDVDILTIGNLENADHPHGFFKNSAGYCHPERIIYIYSRTLRPGFIPLDHTNHLWPLLPYVLPHWWWHPLGSSSVPAPPAPLFPAPPPQTASQDAHCSSGLPGLSSSKPHAWWKPSMQFKPQLWHQWSREGLS